MADKIPLSDLVFHDLGLSKGVWRGRLTGEAAPARLCVTLHGKLVAEAPPQAGQDGWDVALSLPAAVLDEGVHSLILLADLDETGAVPGPAARQLARLPIIAGAPLDGDLRAEIIMMRAEIDLLKRALRQLANR